MRKFRTIVSIAVALLSFLPASARQRNFILTCGRKAVDVIWTINEFGEWYDYTITTGPQKEHFTVDRKFRTFRYHIVNPAEKTDATVTREGGIYTFKGTFKGRPVDRTEESSGYPWYQNLEFNDPSEFEGGYVTFECIRPTELDLYLLKATSKGRVKEGGYDCIRVRATVTGPLAGIWGCDYYYDANTREFIIYKAVEGPPGTPITMITPVYHK